MASQTSTFSSSNPIIVFSIQLPFNYNGITPKPLVTLVTATYVIYIYPVLEFSIPQLQTNSVTQNFANRINTYFKNNPPQITTDVINQYGIIPTLAFFELQYQASPLELTLTIGYSNVPKGEYNTPPITQIIFSEGNKSPQTVNSGSFYIATYNGSLNADYYTSSNISFYLSQPLSAFSQSNNIYIVAVITSTTPPFPVFAYEDIFQQYYSNKAFVPSSQVKQNQTTFTGSSGSSFSSSVSPSPTLYQIYQEFSKNGTVVGIFPVVYETVSEGKTFNCGPNVFSIITINKS